MECAIRRCGRLGKLANGKFKITNLNINKFRIFHQKWINDGSDKEVSNAINGVKALT
jgi:hypothetical protein